MLSRVAQFAERTKALAGTALEALDAPDSDSEDQSPVADPDVSAVLGPVSNGADNRLKQLVQAITGQSADNPIQQADALITQISLVRDNAGAAKHLSVDVTDLLNRGSIVAALNQVIETPDKTAETLLDALNTEQEETLKLRQQITRLQQATESAPQVADPTDDLLLEIARLKEQLVEMSDEKERAEIETQKTHRMLAKVVKEKADMELERDNEDRIDARVMRSAFATLCAQIDNVSVRNGVLMVMAELLQLSPDDRIRCNVPTGDTAPVQRKPSGLANEFMKFLQEELDSPKRSAQEPDGAD